MPSTPGQRLRPPAGRTSVFLSSDPATVPELAGLAIAGSWHMLSRLLRSRSVAGWVTWSLPVTGALWAFMLGRWWLLLVVPVGVVVLGALAQFGNLLICRLGVGGRVLLLERTATGRAVVTARPQRSAGDVVFVGTTLFAVPARGAPPVGRGRRPGALVLRRAAAEARAQGVGLRLQAGSHAVARRVYLPAGFVYDQGQSRRLMPRMHLPL